MDTREIYLTQGMVTTVSADDYLIASARKWQAQYNPRAGKWYAVAVAWIDGVRKKLYLHRVITSCPRGLVVDHENGDGLSNWRENLRVTTTAFNNANCCSFGVVPYRGVTKHGCRFRARINDRHLGMFNTAEEAARAYDAAALVEWGAFAWLNFTEKRPRTSAATQECPF